LSHHFSNNSCPNWHFRKLEKHWEIIWDFVLTRDLKMTFFAIFFPTRYFLIQHFYFMSSTLVHWPRKCSFEKNVFVRDILKLLNTFYLYAGYCWIGLQDCSIWIAIQFARLDCDWQSKFKIGFLIWNVNPAFTFQSKSKKIIISIHELKFHDATSKTMPSYVQNLKFLNYRLIKKQWVVGKRDVPWE